MSGGGGDRLGALPDHLLEHVLSFIPTRESVQASMLSRRWRHIWRSTPALRVDGNAKGYDGDSFAMFVNHFLLLRDGASPLREFEMDIEVSYDDVVYAHGVSYADRHLDLWIRRVELWIRHAALTCFTIDLTARVASECSSSSVFHMTAQPFATSQNLTKLKLCNVSLGDGALDLSGCPALLKLTLSRCFVGCEAIMSPSLHRLRVDRCNFMNTTTTRISTPSLRRLHLFECCADTHPSLESMPFLTTAIVCLPKGKRDSHDHGVLLLHALSEATSLKLIAPPSDGQVIFQRDLTCCPTFRNLKTLILNEWCIHEDEAALACLLRHSPILENLIFEIPKHGPEPPQTNRSYITLEQTTLEQLKTVEIKCSDDQISSWLFEIWKVLTTFGVPLSKISIQATTWQSETYNFFCTGISSKET